MPLRFGAAAALCLAAANTAGATVAAAQQTPAAIVRISDVDEPPEGHWVCSGALVAPDLVLTAGHCAADLEGGRHRVRIAAAFSGGRPDVRRMSRDVVRARDVAARGVPGLADDVALIVLDHPVGADEITPIPLALVPDSREMTLFAFARTSTQMASAERCRPQAMFGRVVGLDCAVESGNSGGAVLRREGDGLTLAAVMVATSTGNAGPRSWAVVPPPELVDRVLAARAGTSAARP